MPTPRKYFIPKTFLKNSAWMRPLRIASLALAAVAAVIAFTWIFEADGPLVALVALGAGLILFGCFGWVLYLYSKKEDHPIRQPSTGNKRFKSLTPEPRASMPKDLSHLENVARSGGAERAVEMFFATNRARRPDGAVSSQYTKDRSSDLNFGAVRVHVPHDHKIGVLELPKSINWIKLRFVSEKDDPEKHFIIESVEPIDPGSFAAAASADPEAPVLIYVHGFNTTFEDSILRFSQIVWDIQFRGFPVLFSWPSAGGVLNYLYDMNSAHLSRDPFRQLLMLLRGPEKRRKLHIMAHSMGNLLVLEALSTLSGSIVDELVLAAPDVDLDVFRNLIGKVQSVASGMTLYASGKDRALVLSRSIAKSPRAGDVFDDGPVKMEHLDSIDVTAVGAEMFGLNHNEFAPNRNLVDDIGRLLTRGDRPPNHRSPQIRAVPEGSLP